MKITVVKPIIVGTGGGKTKEKHLGKKLIDGGIHSNSGYTPYPT